MTTKIVLVKKKPKKVLVKSERSSKPSKTEPLDYQNLIGGYSNGPSGGTG